MNLISKQWELSILEFSEDEQLKYKVTRRLPILSVAETKITNTCVWDAKVAWQL